FFIIVPSLPTSTLVPYTTLFRSVNPSRIGNKTVSTRGSSLTSLLYAISIGVDLSFFLISSNTFPLHNTLSERIIPPLFIIGTIRSEEHTSELQSRENLVCRLLLE